MPEESVDPREEGKALLESPITEDFLVIARSTEGVPLFYANPRDQVGLGTAEMELELLALFVARLADRTGRSREALLEELVENLNEVEPRWGSDP